VESAKLQLKTQNFKIPSGGFFCVNKEFLGFLYQHFGGPQRDNASLSHGAGGNGYKTRRNIIRTNLTLNYFEEKYNLRQNR
jgi:hypothetical protein